MSQKCRVEMTSLFDTILNSELGRPAECIMSVNQFSVVRQHVFCKQMMKRQLNYLAEPALDGLLKKEATSNKNK